MNRTSSDGPPSCRDRRSRHRPQRLSRRNASWLILTRSSNPTAALGGAQVLSASRSSTSQSPPLSSRWEGRLACCCGCRSKLSNRRPKLTSPGQVFTVARRGGARLGRRGSASERLFAGEGGPSRASGGGGMGGVEPGADEEGRHAADLWDERIEALLGRYRDSRLLRDSSQPGGRGCRWRRGRRIWAATKLFIDFAGDTAPSIGRAVRSSDAPTITRTRNKPPTNVLEGWLVARQRAALIP